MATGWCSAGGGPPGFEERTLRQPRLQGSGFGVCRIGAEKRILGNSDLVWGLGFGVYDFREFRFSLGFRVWGIGLGVF